MELRDYQTKAIDDLREAIRRGSRAPLLQAATGAGKTVIAAAMIDSAMRKGKHVLFLATRRQLVYQTSQKLNDFGIFHGVIMSGERPSFIPQVQVASVQTIHRRCFEDGEVKKSGMSLPRADVIFVDEAHANFSTMTQAILAQYPDAVVVGMTATPCRGDGRGLGEIYDAMVCGPSVRWLMDNGYLAELRYFGPSEWDMSGVKIQGGDYHQGQLSTQVNKPKLVGDVVENWTRIAPDRTTVVFCVDRKHAMALHTEFQRWGVASEYIDGNTENDERAGIFQRLESGESRVLCSVAVVDMGWDMPAASCAVLARPTKSISRYLQAVGRILRMCEGKEDACLIDHTGAVRDIGFVDDDFEWTLDGVSKQQERDSDTRVKEETTITCPGCSRLIRPAPQCPECGMEMKSIAMRAIEAKRAELQEIERSEANKAAREMTLDEKGHFFAGLKGYAMKKGFKTGWAAHAYREKTGVWPNHPTIKNAPAKDPDDFTRGWIQHLNIKKAKRRAAQQA